MELASIGRAPALLKLCGVGFREVIFCIALHVNDTELNIGLRKEAFGDGQASGEIVLNNDHDATQSAFDETAQDGLPILEIFSIEFGDAGQDSLLSVTSDPM